MAIQFKSNNKLIRKLNLQTVSLYVFECLHDQPSELPPSQLINEQTAWPFILEFYARVHIKIEIDDAQGTQIYHQKMQQSQTRRISRNYNFSITITFHLTLIIVVGWQKEKENVTNHTQKKRIQNIDRDEFSPS